MRILIISQSINPIVSCVLASKYEVVGLIENAQRGHGLKSQKFSLKSVLKSLIKRFKPAKPTLFELCEKQGIPYRFMRNSSDKGLKAWISDLNPDLIVVYSMSSLLKPELFEIPKMGTINVHGSFLPDYRGPKPCFWQYYDLELKPGVTVHYIDEGEDTGDIILQERVPIVLGLKNKERMHQLINVVGVRLLLSALDLIESGTAPRIPQPNSSSTQRARNIKPEEHQGIIDWKNWSGERIWHLLRGTEDWLNAFPQPKGLYKGSRWIIGEFTKCTFEGNIGVIFKEKSKFFIGTKDGKIQLLLPKFSPLKRLKVALKY